MELPKKYSHRYHSVVEQNGRTSQITFPEGLKQQEILKFLCVLPTKPPQNDAHEVITIEVPAGSTVKKLRLLIWMNAKIHSCQPQIYDIADPESYQLLYKKGANWYEIYDDFQILLTLDALRYWKSMGMQRFQIHIRPKPTETDESKKFEETLKYLIGYDIGSMDILCHEETGFARRRLASPRQAELKKRDPVVYALEPWVATVPFPENLKTLISDETVITIHYMKGTHKMKVCLQDSPKAIFQTFIQKLSERGLSVEKELVLKVCGRDDYISDNKPLIDFLWIRQCLKNKQEIHLSLLPTPSSDEKAAMNDWPLVDESTGFSKTHEELQLTNKDPHQVLALSLWECDRRFRVKLVGIDIPTLPSKAPQNVYIEACILHGRDSLSSVTSKPMPFREEVLWNTWMEFDILVKDLPYGSRLNLSVNSISAESMQKDGKLMQQPSKEGDTGKSKGKLLYFVNLLLIDHRSMLQQGEFILHMWPYPEQEEALFTFEADRLSSKMNPEIDTSMAIAIALDTYNYPVTFPYCRSLNSICSSPAARRSRSSNTEQECFPPSSVTTSERHLLERFTEQCAKYGNSLPSFLTTINWANHEAVQDLHWLLLSWNPQNLNIAIALELLSINFSDEKVRRMSVKRLKQLENDELMRYLLQLVQALKFEPYHDSALARFLIQRALRSKRIGHFFFWYLRSEITCSPYFCDRFAVILEAYLRGCSWPTLEELYKQVQVVENLHQVALDIKKLYPEKTDLPANAALQLQELLKNVNLPEEFIVPYNPRIRAGKILLDKCKVMPSKKKPLWLEFNNCDPFCPSSSPVGIIFKHGDDLRQDMLIIQTLDIMDSIWQENSLDLNLVPYGCISTGNNIGMIEIVRDATTIANVQRSRGGTTRAFKDDALLEWLKTQCKVTEMYYQAMEKFVTSCAGYCVATYVLGIGDRHNDNIMITDQGYLHPSVSRATHTFQPTDHTFLSNDIDWDPRAHTHRGYAVSARSIGS
ncbi:phosphatidylinositol 4,5-bisphosphate 3-kinase catalytic subunit gamma isoform-like isoform X2 [Protopterus annectens]|uniref:phosphatidylinositol 4,5-bisphosphate 3-kinase catalytic subunit gamma isoform-like isoform X2 n=1 Tax=Protopterus annectens TaxID=7888 RepID=UPI001CF9B33A|nr:phosphatidylinositol 4,5-bisphosphate 3-kinase catalytic subunit gamma isoform-like isoform X2 [Protopterus annectens]